MTTRPRLPLRVRLALTMLTGIAIALAIAMFGFTLYDVRTFRDALVRRLTAVADVMGANSMAALRFKDADAAREIIDSARLDPHIEALYLYDATGAVFVSFVRPDLPRAVEPGSTPSPLGFSSRAMEVRRPVVDHGDVIGQVYLRSDTVELRDRLINYLEIDLAVLVAAGLLGVFLTAAPQRRIVEPIGRLARAARRISVERKYDVRVEGEGEDELGVLVAAFNEMLVQIEARDTSLRTAREELEQRVLERTRELRAEIDERERAERDAQRARGAAEAASRLKSEFLANMSHEIRTPINGIMGMTDIVLESELTSHQRECLEMARSSSTSLLQVINDVLDFSKIEAGRMDVESSPFDVVPFVGEVVRLFALRAKEKGVTLAHEIGAEVPRTVVGDPHRLQQVLVNVVGNALKFTDKGRVTVRVATEASAPGSSTVRFTVEDTGIGIAPEKQALVFEAFAQADGSHSRRFGGTGLGLSISSRLVGLMGGRMWVESEPGKGSRFHFTIRFEEARAGEPAEHAVAQAPPSASRPVRSLRVLVAEDNPVNQRLAVHILERRGHRVSLANDGREAVAATSRETFDVILMDVQMPELDGFAATREIRSRESGTGRHVPIIAVTAHALKGDRERCLTHGMDEYLSKPIKAEELIAILESIPLADDALVGTP